MGSITRSFANNIGSSGILTASAVNNATVEDVTSFDNAANPATLVLLSTQTANNSATISFTTGLDSTYDAYEFKFIDIHPRTDNASLQFQGSTNGGTSYGITITSSFFIVYHDEADTATSLQYQGTYDLAQSTSYQAILPEVGNGADESGAGSLQLFNPSSTTYVKHFIGRANTYNSGNFSLEVNVGGYFNTTTAINAIQFQMSSGNFDGTIKLYGVKKS
jgi:hypothetical protein